MNPPLWNIVSVIKQLLLGIKAYHPVARGMLEMLLPQTDSLMSWQSIALHKLGAIMRI